MNRYKKWTIEFFAIVIAAFVIMGGLIVIVDPYFQYHKPLDGFGYVIDEQLTQNPGLARNLNYDAVILGSSVTVNFDTNWFDEDFGIKTVKLPYNGAYPKDFANIIEQIEMSDNNLKYVFWTMDVASFSGDINETKYPIEKNLYDTNLFNDISYIFNKDILINYVLIPAVTDRGTGLNNAYSTHQYLVYGREACLENFFKVNPEIDNEKVMSILDEGKDIDILRPEENHEEDAFIERCEANLEANILPFIENHPETQFIISFPPYSILNWMIYVDNGSYDALMKEYELVIDTLSKYDNVVLYNFCDDTDISYNLDLYADSIHYNQDICHYIEQEFANKESKYIITR